MSATSSLVLDSEILEETFQEAVHAKQSATKLRRAEAVSLMHSRLHSMLQYRETCSRFERKGIHLDFSMLTEEAKTAYCLIRRQLRDFDDIPILSVYYDLGRPELLLKTGPHTAVSMDDPTELLRYKFGSLVHYVDVIDATHVRGTLLPAVKKSEV